MKQANSGSEKTTKSRTVSKSCVHHPVHMSAGQIEGWQMSIMYIPFMHMLVVHVHGSKTFLVFRFGLIGWLVWLLNDMTVLTGEKRLCRLIVEKTFV